jgi:GNAT superfamily N-acetyltransferase
MPLALRAPAMDELPGLGDLCARSKAVWGYHEKFIEACRAELSFNARDLLLTQIAVAEENERVIGVAQVKVVESEAELLKLFIDPAALRNGVGKVLFAWAANTARMIGARRLLIEADPDAAPFYRRMGARDAGLAPSGSIAGRMLPKLVLELCTTG